MDSEKPHVVCIPVPLQSHMMAMLKLAKLLYVRGFHVTFVNTDLNHRRLLRLGGPRSLDGLPGFRFETVPDGPSLVTLSAAQDVSSLDKASIRGLVEGLNARAGAPPVTWVVTDGCISPTVWEDVGVRVALFYPIPACAFIAYWHSGTIKEKGILPRNKDESTKTNGYLDTIIDWIPGLNPTMRLRNLPSFIQAKHPRDEILLTFAHKAVAHSHKASAVVFHTFEALEPDALASLEATLPRAFGIGPIQLLLNENIATIPQEDQETLQSIDCSLWSEEAECLRWLGSNDPGSVVYINFGSITVLSPQELIEFGWGLANSKHPFLWVIRPDLVAGESAVLPQEFAEEVRERSFLTSWCAQEEVLAHPSVGAFLTHCGWNSTLESLCSGVPAICWNFFGDQTINSWYICNDWGFGVEMDRDRDVERGKVERVVREVMEGEKGKELKEKALEWKRKAEEAIGENGSSSLALDKLVSEVLVSKHNI